MRRFLEPKLVALVAALGLVAQSEWMLARAVGWPIWVAWLAPLALDAYVIDSVRNKRDLGPSVIVSALSVLASHAVYAAPNAWRGDHLVWYLAAVCSVVPLLVAWRVHHLHQPESEPVAAILAPVEAPTPRPQAPRPAQPKPNGNGKAQATDDDLERLAKPLVAAGKGRPTVEKALRDAGLTCETSRLADYIRSVKGLDSVTV